MNRAHQKAKLVSLNQVVARIVKSVQPDKVILFGSWARGEAHSQSDLDLLVIKESVEPRFQRSIPIHHALRDILMPMDIIVYTPAEINDWQNVRQAFITTAIREGKVLYEKKG